jgi:hypothetical protein
MNEHSEIFITDGMMHIYSYSEVFIDEWNNAGEIKKGTVYENYTPFDSRRPLSSP